MMVAIPAWYAGRIPAPFDRTAGMFEFSNFAHTFDRALPYAILPATLFLIRLLNRKDRYELSPAVISCGSLLFAYYLCGQNITVLFVPIPLLVGYTLFRLFLIHPVANLQVSPAAGAVGAFLEMKDREVLAKQRKKALDKKFAQAEIAPPTYELGVSDIKQFTDSGGPESGLSGGSQAGRIFSLGPQSGPWDNATAFWRLFRGSQKRKSKAGKGI
jgi:hypothetical protein